MMACFFTEKNFFIPTHYYSAFMKIHPSEQILKIAIFQIEVSKKNEWNYYKWETFSLYSKNDTRDSYMIGTHMQSSC